MQNSIDFQRYYYKYKNNYKRQGGMGFSTDQYGLLNDEEKSEISEKS